MKKSIKKRIVFTIPIGVLAGVTVLSLLPPSKLPHPDSWLANIPYGDKAVHFCFYFCLATAIRFARTHAGRYDRHASWKLLILTAAYGGAIELLQGHYFGRGSDPLDEAANILGAAAALWLIPQTWHETLNRKIDPQGRE
jgi:VanZ family protein